MRRLIFTLAYLTLISFTKESERSSILTKSVHEEKPGPLSQEISHNLNSPSNTKGFARETTRKSSKSSDHENCQYSQPETECSEVGADCLECEYNNVPINIFEKCEYGLNITVTCKERQGVVCKTPGVKFQKEIVCQFCYQTARWQQICNGVSVCNSVLAPRQLYIVNCTVTSDTICLGHRNFKRMMVCDWVNGYRWSTTLLLSITLGGFGADRFYLGRWQEGIGKLFSFGGLGIWTIVDIILIAVRFLGPADGSLYVD